MTWETTLDRIRSHRPCTSGWQKLLTHLGKTKADEESLPLLTVLESNGLNDAIWCLRAIDGHDREIRLFAVWCARQVQHLMTDQRSLTALNVSERYAVGQATNEELTAAQVAAGDVTRTAVWAAVEDAAKDAAWAAAKDAAWAAAWAASLAVHASWEDVWAASDTQRQKLIEVINGTD